MNKAKIGPIRWQLVVVSTAAAPSSLRVHVWRKLRSLGALYLQQSVCLLPERPETSQAMNRLVDRVTRDGGEARVLAMTFTDPAQEAGIIESFAQERSDEYAEVVSRTPAFLEELEQERRRGRLTYAEVEESEADLERFRTWLARIQARDYFAAPGGDEAVKEVDRCAAELAKFEAEALATESGGRDVAKALSGELEPRLRKIEGGGSNT